MKITKSTVYTGGFAMVAVSLLCGRAEAANLVSNGEFDNIGNVFVDNTGYGSDDLQTAGSTNIPMWNSVHGFANEFWTAPVNDYALGASPGNGSGYFVDLTGQANNKPYGGIEQAITTTPGQKYELSFDLGASTEYNSADLGSAALTASAAGVSRHFSLSPIGPSQWKSETLSFTAVDQSTVIQFLADSAYTSRYTGLDNVRVGNIAAVPEPLTWGMMIVGFAAIGAAMRRAGWQSEVKSSAPRTGSKQD